MTRLSLIVAAPRGVSRQGMGGGVLTAFIDSPPLTKQALAAGHSGVSHIVRVCRPNLLLLRNTDKEEQIGAHRPRQGQSSC